MRGGKRPGATAEHHGHTSGLQGPGTACNWNLRFPPHPAPHFSQGGQVEDGTLFLRGRAGHRAEVGPHRPSGHPCCLPAPCSGHTPAQCPARCCQGLLLRHASPLKSPVLQRRGPRLITVSNPSTDGSLLSKACAPSLLPVSHQAWVLNRLLQGGLQRRSLGQGPGDLQCGHLPRGGLRIPGLSHTTIRGPENQPGFKELSSLVKPVVEGS